MTAHKSCLRIDAQTLPSPHEAERRMAVIDTLTAQRTGATFQDEPATEELALLHHELAALVGLRPEHRDERPVTFRCDCGAYRLVSSATRTRNVWNTTTETNEPSPVCDCPLNAVASLSPRTELFLTAIYAEAAAYTADCDDRRAEFAELADDAMWTARYCDPGGPWDRSNVAVQLIVQEFTKRATTVTLPPYDKGPVRTLLLDAITTALRNLTHGGRPDTAQVAFLATPQSRWSPIADVITTLADNTQRCDLSYPHPALGEVLDELAAIRPPRPGSKLTFTLTSPCG
ncbi:hypothetical protein [Streptomyces mirabilis]|uniref:hypothetical protein n=1 Tax=Streptomyces mirabilis TaxID=68239 RepID=UPI0033DD96A2